MPELPEGSLYSIAGKEFNFSVATSGLELMTGLKGVTSLGQYDGMIFDFGCNFQPIMTPKGLNFPIDIAFVTGTKQVVEIKRLDPDIGMTQSASRRDIMYVIEAPVGFFEDNNITLGSLLSSAQS